MSDCTCWPRSDQMCPQHGDIRRDPHHYHGVYFGDDNWDGECCICATNPCGSVGVGDMVVHRFWDMEQWTRPSGVDDVVPF